MIFSINRRDTSLTKCSYRLTGFYIVLARLFQTTYITGVILFIQNKICH
jgi:hypothetical protein